MLSIFFFWNGRFEFLTVKLVNEFFSSKEAWHGMCNKSLNLRRSFDVLNDIFYKKQIVIMFDSIIESN
jgi:hypothetical protein